MNKPKYMGRVTMISVMPEGEPLFSEKCTHVKIVDEAAGEFIEIVQQSGSVDGHNEAIRINDRDEWEAICNAVGMIWECIDSSEDAKEESNNE
jgi:hypothetical protein